MQNLFVLKGHFSFGFLISSFIFFSHSSLFIGCWSQSPLTSSLLLLFFPSLCPYDVFSCCYSIFIQKYCTSSSWQGMAIMHNATAMSKWLSLWLLNVFQQQLWQIATLSQRVLAIPPHHVINVTDKAEQNPCYYTQCAYMCVRVCFLCMYTV